ncbi:FecCD family ABC transporter permease [Sneathiella aquimaris]|uniref:FecCD family ABC transporter permease n=1 Tax=Sneathiella aquimaris TaxID=2599305 RepID=UPI00146D18F4|nr:iron ABC transporter permease [Sneathiella aquimaris]
MTPLSPSVAVANDKTQKRFVLILFAGLCLSLIVAATIGAVSIPVADLVVWSLSDLQENVLSNIRAPRLVLAALVGAALSISGAALQGLFRNALADPGLIGVSSGAHLSVAIVIVFAGSIGGIGGLYALSLAAFLGSLLACFVIFQFARMSGTLSVTFMLLTGVAINALAMAGVGFLSFISDDQQLRAISLWSMGSVGGALWPSVLVCGSVVVPAVFFLLRNASAMNILLLGEEEAQYLGVDSNRVKRNIIICTALCVGASVALTGLIGFVGLVVPHLVRLVIGPDHRWLIPASALLGGILLTIADTIARTLVAPTEMPVGILTSLIGGPFFLWLLMRQFTGRFGL